ncbi:hypothetical protein YB2330_005407 [Saitoella coloradoensis]
MQIILALTVLFGVAAAAPGHGKSTAKSAWSASSSTSNVNNVDVTLLYRNELNVFTQVEHQSVLLLTPRTASAGAAACSQLNEALLPVNATFFGSDLPPLLEYQVYQSNYPENQQYWIASEGPHVKPSMQRANAPFVYPPGSSNSSKWEIEVQSENLTVTGFRDQLSFRFLGIPYANPAQRWTYPEPYTGPTSINATNSGATCVQTGSSDMSEDCLCLNIFTPYIPASDCASEQLKPVMFWIHGGAFTGGSGSDPTFDGGNMASRGDVVLVTINYRLSTLGFLSVPGTNITGNYGIADQIAALDWVREHIKAFGGDPERITIFGQSAGAASVRALMGSPKAIGKYAAAIQMSNLAGSNYAATYSLYNTTEESYETVTVPILEETGCVNATDQVACLKAYNATELVNLEDVARYVLVDGTYITQRELALNGSAPVADVHFMMGFMRDDGAAFIGYPSSTNETAALEAQSLPDVTGNSLFPVPSGSNATLDVFNVTARVTTNIEFRCLDQATAYAGVVYDLFQDVWFYEFNRSYQTPSFDPNYPVCEAPITEEYPFGDPNQEYFKCHSGELYYVFGNLPTNRPPRDQNDIPFEQEMVDIWTSFARTYNPNPDPRYLTVRNYTSTQEELKAEGSWTPVTKRSLEQGGMPVRELMWPSYQTGWGDMEQCAYLGYPIDYYT